MSLHEGAQIGFSRQVDFFILAVGWFFFGSLFQTVNTSSGVFLAWVLLTSLLSVTVLGAIGYFEHYIPKPELSSVLSLFLALPFSALFSKWILVFITYAPPIRYPEAIRASVWVALIFELLQWVIFKVHRALGKQWVLVTFLLPEELEALQAQVNESGMSWWIKIKQINMSHPGGIPLSGHETVVISRGAAHDLKNHPEFLAAHLRGQRIVDVGQLLKEFRGRVNLYNADAWTFLLGSTYQSFLIRFYFYLKTFLEPVLALILLVLLSPLWIAVALGVYLTDGNPILYRQERLGYRGQRFSLIKFRTMSTTAEGSGPQWARENDPRVTPIGGWLRRTRLDELPQLLNVLRRELSFVGPRPERPEFYQMLNGRIPLFPLRLLVRPGITGWAQVEQGYVASVEESKTKLEYDLYYVQNMSPRLDLRVTVNTLALMMRGNSGR